MKILVTGRNGQVGGALAELLPQALPGHEIIAVDRTQLDLANLAQVREVMQAVRPDLVINPAAYTAVDLAESEADTAMLINGEAPGVLAEEAKRLGAGLIHFSTDYVYDGRKQGAWVETDATGPLSVYGRSKLAGELAIAAVGLPHVILRTSWVYGLTGKNFLLTMLRLAQTRDELGIVSDQSGAPTWSRTLADATLAIVNKAGAPHQMAEVSGVYHCCAGGHTSWFGFAQAIFAHPAVTRRPALKAIGTADYPTPAVRPGNSVMDTRKFEAAFGSLPQWHQALDACMQGMTTMPSA
jgi:dTDP-4-dehydrorhamnose reductase